MTFKEFYTEATEVPLTNWADLQQKSPMLKAAVGLLAAIEEVNSSAEALIVGGAVRQWIVDAQFQVTQDQVIEKIKATA